MNPSLSRFPAAGDLPSCPALPDPMRSLDGSRIATRQEWVTRRRPELKALFEHYMYGRAPARLPTGEFVARYAADWRALPLLRSPAHACRPGEPTWNAARPPLSEPARWGG